MLVTISGLPGVGTTTVGQALARRLGLPYRSTGDIFREQARAAGCDLAEYNLRAEQSDEVDRALDRQALLEARQADMVLEGRLTGWLTHRAQLPALRVWLEAPLDLRLQRISHREGSSSASLRERILRRQASEAKRYLDYYGIDITEMTPYDLVLDTSATLPEALVRQVIEAMVGLPGANDEA